MSTPSIARLRSVSRGTKRAAVAGALAHVLILLAGWYVIHGDLSGLGESR